MYTCQIFITKSIYSYNLSVGTLIKGELILTGTADNGGTVIQGYLIHFANQKKPIRQDIAKTILATINTDFLQNLLQ